VDGGGFWLKKVEAGWPPTSAKLGLNLEKCQLTYPGSGSREKLAGVRWGNGRSYLAPGSEVPGGGRTEKTKLEGFLGERGVLLTMIKRS